MTARSSIPALLITLLLVIAFVVAACGDDGDDVTDADYLTELFALDPEFQQQGEFLADDFEERIATIGSEQAEVVAIREFSGRALELFTQLLDDSKDLNPTEDLEEAHKRRITALEAGKSAWKDINDQLEDIESVAQLRTLLEQLFTGEAFAGLTPPCFAERAIDIDIGCAGTNIDVATPAATEPSDATPAASPAATQATPAP